MTENYSVVRINDFELEVNGKGDAPVWTKANTIDLFVNPWSRPKASNTEFKSLFDSTNLYFYFKIYDGHIHFEDGNNTFENIGASDRVELFFRKDEFLNPYYCLEIDSRARVMDFKAFPNRKFDFTWNWPKKELIVRSSYSGEHFIVEGSISMVSLKKLGLLRENEIQVGIFRAKYQKTKSDIVPHWISWIDPRCQIPNFHTPSAFGIFTLTD